MVLVRPDRESNSEPTSNDADTGLPGRPFLGQISKIWPRFKLVGLNNFSCFLGFFGLILNRLALRNVFGLLTFFGLFYAGIISYEGKYCYSIFLATHLQNVCDKCYIRPRILILVIFDEC